ncbi:MAG: hypothetical protein GC165_09200 [Armatimonadetes bacterium]|nr:hypothetical protein [Armatimonadota bacterium]
MIEGPSFEIIGKTADVAHEAFWWHRGYREFFEDLGTPDGIVDRAYAEAGSHKSSICRSILKQLCRSGPPGIPVAWKIVFAIRDMSGPVHTDNCNEEAFRRKHARLLESLAGKTDEIDFAAKAAKEEADIQRAFQTRSTELGRIRDRFWELMTDPDVDKQGRGYELERIVGRLCAAHEIPYEKPKSLPGQQSDGSIKFGGKHFVLETRWRKEKAEFEDISKLSAKARARTVGTLGLFISMEGFTKNGVNLWLQSGNQRDCILVHGGEFVKVIDQFIAWPDALNQMIDQAASHGKVLIELTI